MDVQDLTENLETPIAISEAVAACSLSDEEISQLKQTSQRLRLAEMFEQEFQEELAKADELSQKIHDQTETLTLVRDAQDIAARHLAAAEKSAGDLSLALDQSTEHLRHATEIVAETHQKSEVSQQTIRQAEELNRSHTAAITLISSIAQQSSLIALNATILAARSGNDDYALMARDVQELAHQTAQVAELLNNQIAGMERTLNVAATAVSSVCESATRLGQISALQTQSLESQSLIANELPAQLSASAVALEDAANILSGDADSGVEGTTHDLELLHTANELARQFSRLKHSGDCFLQQLLQTP